MGGGAKSLINIDLKINGETFELEKLECDKDKIIIDFENELLIESLELTTSLEIDKIELYKRKFKGLLIAARTDAFGSRMSAFITAMYLASKTGFKFGFVWKEMSKDRQGIVLEKAENIFEEEFLEEYDYTKVIANNNILHFKSIAELIQKPYKESWGHYISNPSILNKTQISDLDEVEYKKEFQRIFFNLPFKPAYKNSILKAKNIASKLGDFVALHMRGGDIIEAKHYRNAWLHYHFYLFPVDLAIFTIRHFIKQGLKVVLFSADKRASLAIKEYLNDEILENNFFIALDFYENFNEMQTILFDFTLISKAHKILANHSTYSKTACFLGEAELLNFNTYFESKELYNAFIIPNFKDAINVSLVQKAASCFYAYILAKKINASFSEKIKLLNLALEFDRNNCGIRVMILDEYFKRGYINIAENYLRNIINEYCWEFINILLCRFWWGIAFQPQFDFYLKYANKNFPYICFVAAKIAEFKKDFKQAQRYINLALKKESENELFLELAQIIKFPTTAKARIQNHLSYKLGSLMIRNSKSFFGFIKMPYLLVAVTLTHKGQGIIYKAKIKANPNLALPPLEKYPDYQEALKEKECFTYKLGLAFMKGYKSWYKGGLVKFYFEAKNLYKEFKSKQAKQE